MNPPLWRRVDLDLNQHWVKDGQVYKVIQLTDGPVVTLRRLSDGNVGMPQDETHVIDSLDFAAFALLKRVWVDGSSD